MGNERILLIEDEEDIRELVKMTLDEAGYPNVVTSSNGEDGLRAARFRPPDLILLDNMLPGMDGLSVCRKLKTDENTRNIPIIMLTARSEEVDIVLGLEMGANDYITKPFSRKVLIARVRAQFRIFSELEADTEIRHNGLVINDTCHTAKINGLSLELTLSEYEIIKLLARHPGRVFTRNQLIKQIKGDGYPVTERAIDVQIVNLRRKLGAWGANINTVRGVGYQMKTEQ